MAFSNESGFPCGLCEKADGINRPDGLIENGNFPVDWCEGSSAKRVEQVEPQRINPIANSEAFRARHFAMNDEPDLIGDFSAFDDRQELRGGVASKDPL